ncbi:MAG: magnesium transporter [Patescibacteria group bacterium]|jgi:mgtE-like transporter|nr:magnesium transporter [Patescibacteria group bacterium]
MTFSNQKKESTTPVSNLGHHGHHWHYIKKRRTRKVHHTTKEILIGQMVSISGALIAGLALELSKTELIAMAGAFLILPGVFDLGGSIAGAMGARINHHLQNDTPLNKLASSAVKHSFLLLSVAGLVVALCGATIGSLLFDGEFIRIFTVAYFSILIAGLLGLPIVAIGTIKAFKIGLDPDNFIGPIETSVFDTLTVLVVTMMVILTS